MAETAPSKFMRPTIIERIFNRIFGWIVGTGIGFRDSYVLEVAGRKSGKVYATPVYIMLIDNRTFLVCPRGRAQWVINAEASGKVWLKKGDERIQYAIRAVSDADKPELLRDYLDRFKLTVQRYFPVPPGSSVSAFVPIADRYPVFQLFAADRAR
jgi:deazaflavin-dependent oxidoreductase (nitroreductase family)